MRRNNVKHLKTVLSTITLLVLFLGFSSAPAQATIHLHDWGLVLNGDFVDSFSHPGGIAGAVPLPGAGAGFVPGTAATATPSAGFFDLEFLPNPLGSLSLTVTGAGTHTAILLMDFEYDQLVNGFTNENGATGGAAATAGQSWEIDDYGSGDIIFNTFDTDFFVAGPSLLDGANGLPAPATGDVAMALGWDFTLAAGDSATITWTTAPTAPAAFHLIQNDVPPTGGPAVPKIYFSSALAITPAGGGPVPEPLSWLLLSFGLAGAGVVRRVRG